MILALLGIACLFISWLLMFSLPGSRVYAWVILALGTILLASSLSLDFSRVRKRLTSWKGRSGLSTMVGSSLFIGIILLINGISAGVYHRFDMTGLAQFTLTSQTKNVLEKLDQPVEVIKVFTPNFPAQISSYAQNLLEEYQVYSDKLTVRSIDPELEPDQARQYGLDQVGALYGSIVFKGSFGYRQVYGPQIVTQAEHAFTSAILEVTGTRQKKIYFLIGHGEHSINQEYASVKNGLLDNLFQVDTLDLVSKPEIPKDATVIVMAGPRSSLGSAEKAIIEEYLRAGGRLYVLVDPNPPQDVVELIAKWWIDIEKGFLVEPASYVAPNRDNPLVPRSRNSLQLQETFFAGATATLPQNGTPDGVELNALVWTSPEAWLEKEGTLAQEATFNPDTDREGPLAIGALVAIPDVANEVYGTRVAIIGDSDFAINRNFQNGANSALFLTTVNWLSAGEEIISIDRKVLTTRRLLLNPEQARFLNLSSIGLLPILLLIAGGYVWWRMR